MFNGKFLSGATRTGVHRVALELIQALDRLLDEGDQGGDTEWVLLCPRNATPPALKKIKVETAGRLTWQFWEQIELPWFSRGDLLVSLCNLAPLAKRRSIAMIHDAQTFRSPQSYSRAFAAYYQFALPMIGRNAARILTVSEFARQDLANFGVARLERTTVIHNGVDHVAACEPDIRILERLGVADRPFVVSFASLQAHKNIGILFEAFARPEMSGLKLVFAGSGDARTYVEHGYKPPENAIFAGRVSDGELAALYAHAVCLAFPSTTEGFGLPPLEAMSLGCPTVVAPCGALPEVCGEAALYAPPHDAAAWAQAILALTAETAERRSARIGAARAQAGRFTWARSAERFLKTIEEVRRSLD